MTDLLQVRQAARMLGVHENTLRRWEQKGLLHAVRLPSGVRRFDSAEVEAVRAEMYRGMPAPAAEESDDVVPVRATPIDD
ncbi:MAG: MerR family DNA-binding transcriptional regulator [Solirubrobacteraceae bacterium]|jgi:excisionase family DNA binding protein